MRVAAGGLVQSAAGVTDQRPAVYKLCAAVYKRGARHTKSSHGGAPIPVTRVSNTYAEVQLGAIVVLT